jgi:hypothetical protein
LLIAALGVLTYLPALRTPRFLDDYLHKLMIDGRFPVARSPLNLYDFVGDDDRALFVARGLVPWWSDPELKLRFFRPLASGLLWFEQRVLGFGIALQHLHSFAWWLVCVLAARALFRRLLPPRAALLTTLVYAFAPCHALPLAWIANRNALLSLAFGTLALGSYLSFRERPSLWHGLSAGLLFALSLLSGEYALCFGGYVLALELTRPALRSRAEPHSKRARLQKRALGVMPFVVPALAYLVLRGALDYGTSGSGFYVDPLREPWAFARSAPLRLAALLAQGWLTVGPEVWLALPPAYQWLVFPCVLTALVVLALALRRVYASLPPALRHHARWLLLGSMLAIVPVLPSLPSPRLMGIALLGIAVQLGLLLDYAWFPAPSTVRNRAFERLGVVATALGFVHFIHGPVSGWLAASSVQRSAQNFITDVARIGERLEQLESSRVVVLRGGVESLFGPFALVALGGPWTRWDLLSDPSHLLTLRRSERSLELVAPEDASLCPSDGYSLFRNAEVPLLPEEEFRAPGFKLRILAAGEQGPTRARVTFSAPIGPGQLWVARTRDRLRETPPPAVGTGTPSDG